MSASLTDYDPADDWSDLRAAENPIKEAHDCGGNVSFDVYSRQGEGVRRGHPDYILSGSDLREFDNCPHRWLVGYRDGETKSTEWGQLIDCLLMDPDSFGDRFVLVPETYVNEKGETKEWNFNAKKCQAWREAHEEGGRTEVKGPLYASARKAADILSTDPQLREVFQASRKQVMLTGFYDDADTGLRVPLRCLIDLVPPTKFLADLKTSVSAERRAWARHVHQFGYHEQAARHLDLWNAAHGDARSEFRHYIQENFEPFEVGKRILSSEFISLGRDKYVRALKKYARCIKDNNFPGYDQAENPFDIVVDGHLVTSPEPWMVTAA